MPPKESDLACERHRADTATPGVSFLRREDGRFVTETLHITSKEGAAQVGRPEGTYITLHHPTPESLLPGEADALSHRVADVLSVFLPESDYGHILAVGLGNRRLTADAVGPQTLSYVGATAHMAKEEPRLFSRLGCRRISAFCPGVLGDTGVEAAALVRGAVAAAEPDAILVFDALAARGYERLFTTVQIADTGIIPGSGVGNRRAALDKETMGIPVISVGIPTVVDAATLALELFKKAPPADAPESQEPLPGGAFYVCPRSCDEDVSTMARILGESVNLAFGIPTGEI